MFLTEFRELVESEKDNRAQTWNKIVKTSYAFIFEDPAIDIGRATTKGVGDKFKEQGLSGDTVRKAITFFQHICKAAGINVSPHIRPLLGQPRSRPPRSTKNNGLGAKRDEIPRTEQIPRLCKNMGSGIAATTKSPYEVLIDILQPDMTDEEQAAVWTLIRCLKKLEVNAD